MPTPISQIRRGGASGGGASGEAMLPAVSSPMQSNQPPMMMPPTDVMNPAQNENELVEDILREINGNQGDSNISGGAFQYATDQAQVPSGPPPSSEINMKIGRAHV